MNRQQYYAEVQTIDAGLIGCSTPVEAGGRKLDVFFLTSLDNSQKGGGVIAGRFFDIPTREQAARLIADKTHRLSTPEEIEQFHSDLKRRTDELAAIELSRKQQFAMPQELQTLVASAATLIHQQQASGKRAVKE